MKKILLIGTGGTIASELTASGLAPELTTRQLVALVSALTEICEIDCVELLNLDSTNMQPRHWLQIAQCIRQNYDGYDGFVLTHGTDTMAYTAAALSYLIQGSPKPIVLTGAQKPIGFDSTDSKINLMDAFRCAAEDLPGVSIVFNSRVILGTRAKKTRSKSFQAFSSINYPDLGVLRDGVLLRYIRIFSELTEQLRYATQKRVLLEVTLIKLCTPAMEVKTDSLLDRIRALEEKLEKGLAAAQAAVPAGMYPGGPGGYPEGMYPGGSPEGGYPGGSGGYPEGSYPGGYPAGPGSKTGAAAKQEVPLAIPEDVQEVVKNFRSIAEEVSAPVSTYLKKARLSLGGENRLMVVLPDGLGASIVGTEEHKKELEEKIEQRIGKKVEVEVREIEEGRRFEDTFIDLEKLKEKINMDIIVEDN